MLSFRTTEKRREGGGVILGGFILLYFESFLLSFVATRKPYLQQL